MKPTLEIKWPGWRMSLVGLALLLGLNLHAQWAFLGQQYLGDSLLQVQAMALEDDGKPFLLQKGSYGWQNWQWSGAWQSRSTMGLPSDSTRLLQLRLNDANQALLAMDRPLSVYRLDNGQWAPLGSLPAKPQVRKLALSTALNGKLWLACSWANPTDSTAIWKWEPGTGWALAWESEASLGGFGLNDQFEPIVLLNSPRLLLHFQAQLPDTLAFPAHNTGTYLDLQPLYNGTGTAFVALHRDNLDAIRLDTFQLGQWLPAIWPSILQADEAALGLSPQGAAYIVGVQHANQSPPQVWTNRQGQWQLEGGLHAYNNSVSLPSLALASDQLYLAFLDDESPGRGSVMQLQNPLAAASTDQPADLFVYPNPFRDDLQITLPECAGKALLELLDAEGKVLRTEMLSCGKRHALSIQGLPAAVYCCRLSIQKGGQTVRYHRKLVKLP